MSNKLSVVHVRYFNESGAELAEVPVDIHQTHARLSFSFSPHSRDNYHTQFPSGESRVVVVANLRSLAALIEAGS